MNQHTYITHMHVPTSQPESYGDDDDDSESDLEEFVKECISHA